MNELSNTVTAVGTYNNIPTALTSNTSIVNMIDGLTITKETDKQNWIDGLLTYTITITNNTNNDYVAPTITDIINTDLVELVKSTIMINDVSANDSDYNYDNDTHTLTITLNNISANDNCIISFSVKKKTIENSI